MTADGKPLAGKVALVTGASRGLGMGTAIELGAAGATVYVTARTYDRPGDLGDAGRVSIDRAPAREERSEPGIDHQQSGTAVDTARAVSEAGGTGIPVQCDHTDDAQNRAVARRIADEQGGLDLLVHSAYSTPGVMSSTGPGVPGGAPFWATPVEAWDIALTLAVRGAFVLTQAAMPALLDRRGLIVHVSSAGAGTYFQSVLYGVGKAASDRMMRDMAVELRGTGVTSLAVWPGWVVTDQTELMFAEAGYDLMRAYQRQAWAHFPDRAEAVAALTDDDLRGFLESPRFTGRAIAALAADPGVHDRNGRALATVNLADEYRFTDLDGRAPDGFRFRERKHWPGLG